MSARSSREENINNYADMMLNKINECIKNAMKNVVRVEAAIVESVNENGTVNVYFPTNKENLFTNIQNQSIYQDLVPGDGVEILLKDGTYNNCWIIAKHGGKSPIYDNEEIESGTKN